MPYAMPPVTKNADGEERRVGVEIEYAGVGLAESAELIAHCFDGEVQAVQKHVMDVDTALGRFRVELDTSLLQKLAAQSESNREKDAINWEGAVESLLEKVMEDVVPYEIVTPPLPLSKLDSLEQLEKALRRKGAEGTKHAFSSAFGVHLNPEVPGMEAETILAYLQAFVLLYDWLKEDMQVDITRSLTQFASGYPKRYAKQILAEDYQPDIKRLITDYLEENATRNRALDMLPLFCCIDSELVGSYVDDKLVKARPTFHYRLPNCRINEADWSLADEWARWLKVEQLAHEDGLRKEMAKAYLRAQEGIVAMIDDDWVQKSREYVAKL